MQNLNDLVQVARQRVVLHRYRRHLRLNDGQQRCLAHNPRLWILLDQDAEAVGGAGAEARGAVVHPHDGGDRHKGCDQLGQPAVGHAVHRQPFSS